MLIYEFRAYFRVSIVRAEQHETDQGRSIR